VLDSAKERVYIQAYSFTNKQIIDAVIDAKKRGADVQVILDRSHKESDTASTFKHFGIPTFIDAKHAIAHNKVMVVDGDTVITGSFNFTNAAEKSNAENLLVMRDTALANQYRSNWIAHQAHSQPYKDK
jgi:phosphatidylserine/phosphatidylglycerophosphate/cardiolipin synthase-like enzyme